MQFGIGGFAIPHDHRVKEVGHGFRIAGTGTSGNDEGMPLISIGSQKWDAGQIEVITTPLAHPILPLIVDSNDARVGDPTATMPVGQFRQPLACRDPW